MKTTGRSNTETLTIKLLRCPPGVQDLNGCSTVEDGRVVLSFLNASLLPFVTLDELTKNGNSFITKIHTINPSLTHLDPGSLSRAAEAPGGLSRSSIQLRVRGYVTGISEPVADGIAKVPLDLGPIPVATGEAVPSSHPAPTAPARATRESSPPSGDMRQEPSARMVERSPPVAPPTPADTPGRASVSLRYFVVLDAVTHTPVVIAGRSGLKSGDRILEIDEDPEEAVAALRRLNPGASSRQPPQVPAPAQPKPTSQTIVPRTVVPDQARHASRDEPVVRPNSQLAAPSNVVSLGSSRALIVSSGAVWILKADPDDPEHAYLTGAPPRLTGVLTQQPLGLSVISRGGHVANGLLAFRNRLGDALFFDETGTAPETWQKHHVSFESQIRVGPASVLVLPREDESGTTVGVYIYHYPSGTALYCTGFRHSLERAPARRVEGFPRVPAPPCAVPSLRRGGATRSYLVLDSVHGTMWSVLNVRPHPFTPRIRKIPMDLRGAMHISEGRPLQLAAVPLLAVDRSSDHALLCDGTTGVLAVLDGTGRTNAPVLRTLSGSLAPLLGSTQTPWRPVLLALHDRLEFWILDQYSGSLALITLNQSLTSATVKPVRVDLR